MIGNQWGDPFDDADFLDEFDDVEEIVRIHPSAPLYDYYDEDFYPDVYDDYNEPWDEDFAELS